MQSLVEVMLRSGGPSIVRKPRGITKVSEFLDVVIQLEFSGR
jgi:hypothetical protein